MASHSVRSDGRGSEYSSDTASATMYQSLTVNPGENSPTSPTDPVNSLGGVDAILHTDDQDDGLVTVSIATNNDDLLHVGMGTGYEPDDGNDSGDDRGSDSSSGSGGDSPPGACTNTPPHNAAAANMKRPRALSDALSDELEELDKQGQKEKRERVDRLRKMPRLGSPSATSAASWSEAQAETEGGGPSTPTETTIFVVGTNPDGKDGEQSRLLEKRSTTEASVEEDVPVSSPSGREQDDAPATTYQMTA